MNSSTDTYLKRTIVPFEPFHRQLNHLEKKRFSIYLGAIGYMNICKLYYLLKSEWHCVFYIASQYLDRYNNFSSTTMITSGINIIGSAEVIRVIIRRVVDLLVGHKEPVSRHLAVSAIRHLRWRHNFCRRQLVVRRDADRRRFGDCRIFRRGECLGGRNGFSRRQDGHGSTAGDLQNPQSWRVKAWNFKK